MKFQLNKVSNCSLASSCFFFLQTAAYSDSLLYFDTKQLIKSTLARSSRFTTTLTFVFSFRIQSLGSCESQTRPLYRLEINKEATASRRSFFSSSIHQNATIRPE
ncbi:hypothetical protein Peur_020931 [Populus x canadensis]